MIETRSMTATEIAARDRALCSADGIEGLQAPAREFPAVAPLAECLAAHMIEVWSAQANCTEDDLIARGFTAVELAEHGPVARQLALGRTGETGAGAPCADCAAELAA